MSEERQGGAGWNEWSRHVLKELERLNQHYAKIGIDVSDLKAKVLDYDSAKLTRLQVLVETLEKNDRDQEVRLRFLEQKEAASARNIEVARATAAKLDTLGQKVDSMATAFEKRSAASEEKILELQKREATMSGKWAVLAIIGATLVSIVVGFVFKAFSSSLPVPPEKQSHIPAIEKSLNINELASLRENQ